MTPEAIAALATTFGGGSTTGILVLLALWVHNKRNGSNRNRYVSEEVCKLHQASLQKDIAYMRAGLDRVEQLVRDSQNQE